jgi:uncharacterized membrane protein YqiK
MEYQSMNSKRFSLGGAILLTTIASLMAPLPAKAKTIQPQLTPATLPSSLTASPSASLPHGLPPILPLAQIGGGSWIGWLIPLGGFSVLTIFLIPQIGFLFGLVAIGEKEVGVVIKKFAGKNLPAGRLIALEKEAGIQADTLAPGWYWGYWVWQYNIRKEPVVVVPQGEIGLVIANDGATIPAERILGKEVACDAFQDARKFLTRGGEKGRQLGILTAGTYRINTALFSVITSANADKHGMSPFQLKLFVIKPDMVGVVTTLDGMPIEAGEIAGPMIPGHDDFQNGQKFIDRGGRRGLQEQVILSGTWNLNPWFVQIEQLPMTEVPIGYVGVVISYVGASTEDITGDAFTHGSLVKVGDKGVWATPLYPGKHPLNTKVTKVELVPTTNIVINFTPRIQSEHGYDANLDILKLLSFDGFTYDLEVFQIIHIGALDAPKVISRLGSMQNVVDHVLRPIVGNYFRNSAQEYTILDFLIARSDRQAEAAEYVMTALRAYDVQAVDTLIGRITPPPELMHTLTDRKIAEEQEKTYEVQRMAELKRQELVRETAMANLQTEVVTAEEGVKISDLHARAKMKQASGDAEAIRVVGEAQAEAYQAGVTALGAQSFTAVQLMQIIGDRAVRVVPDVAVNGSGTGTGLMDGLMGMLLWNQHSGSLPINGMENGRVALTPPPAMSTKEQQD